MMRVMKCFIDYTAEEKWLREMANKGYELVGVSLGYNFRKVEPVDAIIRIDYRTFKSQADFIDYTMMFEDSGWKHICGSKTSGNQYFKQIAKNSTAHIFSDALSEAGRYKRVSNVFLTLAMTYVPISIVFILTNTISLEAFTNPKSLYLTPGLWEKQGLEFIGSFLFETPFALGRGFIWLIFPIVICLFLFFAIKSFLLYKRTMK